MSVDEKSKGDSSMQLQLDTRGLKPRKARDLIADALTWIESNPEAWQFIVQKAWADADRFGRVRIKCYIEELRFKRLPFATERIKLPNAYSAAFSRILIAWHPELESCVPTQSSKLDGCSIPPRSY